MKIYKTLVMTMTTALLLLTYLHISSADDASNATSQHDQLKIAAQKICPVSGKPLGSMGSPLKTKIGEEELFLCCQSCSQGQVSREHWATIHSNFAKAQGKCPVMGKGLPAGAKWTVVKGQIFYVCCPPCVAKIKADPKTYFTKLDTLYQQNVGGPMGHDAIKLAVQKICPVSGKDLGSMGTPLKIKIGEEELFLCCAACRKGQVNREHWGTIHSSFAAAQGQCPVMEKPLPANPKWTVVDGQIVYVCCPPCTKKIQADPAKYVARVDSLYSAALRGASTELK